LSSAAVFVRSGTKLREYSRGSEINSSRNLTSLLGLLFLRLDGLEVRNAEVTGGGALNLLPSLELPPADREEDLGKTKSRDGSKASKTIGKVGELVSLKVDVARESVYLLDDVADNAEHCGGCNN